MACGAGSTLACGVGSGLVFSLGFLMVRVPAFTWFSDSAPARVMASSRFAGLLLITESRICIGNPPMYLSSSRSAGVTKCGTRMLNS